MSNLHLQVLIFGSGNMRLAASTTPQGLTIYSLGESRLQFLLQMQTLVLSKKLWSSWSPQKVLPCAWRLLKNRLPTLDNLIRRGVPVQNSICKLCMEHDETTNHLFFFCKVFTLVWHAISALLQICYNFRNALEKAN